MAPGDLVEVALAEVAPGAGGRQWAELGTAELDKLDEEASPDMRDQLATAMVLAYRVLAARAGTTAEAVRISHRCPYCGSRQHGRPDTGLPGLWMSTARTSSTVAVAVAGVPVGLDVEGGPVMPSDLGPVCTTEELALVRARPELAGPLWVLKESLGKAMGTGLVGMETVAVLGGEVRSTEGWLTVAANGAAFSARLVAGCGLDMAVAVAGPPRPVQLTRHRDL